MNLFFFCVFATQLYEFFIYFRYKPLIKHMNCKYFLLFHFISLCFIFFTSAIIPVVTICLSFVFRIRSKKSFLRQLLKRFLPVFFPVLWFQVFYSRLNAFWVQFSAYCKIVVQFGGFPCNCAVSPSSFIAETVLTYLLYFWLVCCWRREWKTTSLFLPWEFHEQYEKKKDMIVKDELPSSVGAQYVTGQITPERMNWWRQCRKNAQFWMWLVMGIKSDMIKNSIA